jgi:CHAT domain-containing protein
MERFYQNHLDKNMGPADALREAQLWLRTCTRAAVLARLEGIHAPRDVGRRIKLGGAQEDRIYESPFYWASFTYTGN